MARIALDIDSTLHPYWDLLDRITGGFGTIDATPPPPTIVSGDAIVKQIQQVSRLETTIYTVERVIEANQSDARLPDWLSGDRLLTLMFSMPFAMEDPYSTVEPLAALAESRL